MASKAIGSGTGTARTRTASKATTATVAPTVAPYRLVTEGSNDKLVQLALALRATPGLSQGAAAGQMAQHMPSGKCTAGQLAMLCYQGGVLYNGTPLPLTRYGSTDKGAPSTPAALALAVANVRNSGNPNTDSWGRIAAAFGITEPCARHAYAAATGTDPANTGVKGWRWRGAVQA